MNRIAIDLGELRNTCFVVMPLHPRYESEYQEVIKPAIEAARLTSVRGDEIFSKPRIMDDIWQSLRSCRIVIAELTGRNPNVLYELGLAHSLGKPVIIITRSEDDVPFDLKDLRYIYYDTNDPQWGQSLRKALTDAVLKVVNSGTFSSYLDGIAPLEQLSYPKASPREPEAKTPSPANVSGTWVGVIPGRTTALQATLHIVQSGETLSATMAVSYEYNGKLTVVQEILAGSVKARDIVLNGVNYTFINRGAQEKPYILDQFELNVLEQADKMEGTIIDQQGHKARVGFEKS